jgi:peptide/nickel transport system permease protein
VLLLKTAMSRVAERTLRFDSRRARDIPWISLSIVFLLLFCAALAPWLAPHDPTEINMLAARMPPGVDVAHPLGTDVLGRDILSRMIYGARAAVIIAGVALGSGAIVGTLLGLVSGYCGGWIDSMFMRVVDAAMSFPTILVAMILMVAFSAGITNLIIAVALTVWAEFARMIRGQVLSIKERDFVILARIAGVSAPVIVARHIFPNTVNLLLIITSLRVGQVILLEASLSFLGLGLPPGAPAWGVMVSEGRAGILDTWWLSLLPGLAITFVVLAFNFLGDWVRDFLDPKLRSQ